MSSSATQTDFQIRYLIRRDMPEVLEIEKRSFEFPWSEEDFLICLRQKNCIGSVAESERGIYGFMIYELHKGHLRLLNLAVAPEVRRTGIGIAMTQRLVDKLEQQKRVQIVTDVRESNLNGQLFFAALGFKARCIHSRCHSGEGQIQFTYTLPSATPANGFCQGGNRISEYFE